MNLFDVKRMFCFGVLLATPTFASTINIDFGSPDAATFTQGVSTTATYTFALGHQISATGYHIGNPVTAVSPLFAKTGVGDEWGLGLAAPNGGSTHEITQGNFIQLDLTSLLSLGAKTSFTLSTGSTTGIDAFTLFLSSVKGSEGAAYKSGNTETSYSFTYAQIAATPFVSLGATSGDVLLGPGTISTAPEPGTIVSLGAGLVLVGLRFKKRFQS